MVGKSPCMAERGVGDACTSPSGRWRGASLGRLVGRAFVWFSAGVTLAWLEGLGTKPFAYLIALAIALGFVELCLWGPLGALSRLAQLPRRSRAGLFYPSIATICSVYFSCLLALIAIVGIRRNGWRVAPFERAAAKFFCGAWCSSPDGLGAHPSARAGSPPDRGRSLPSIGVLHVMRWASLKVPFPKMCCPPPPVPRFPFLFLAIRDVDHVGPREAAPRRLWRFGGRAGETVRRRWPITLVGNPLSSRRCRC